MNDKKITKKAKKKIVKRLHTKVVEDQSTGRIEAQINSGTSVHEFELMSLNSYRNEILQKLQLEEREGIEQSLKFLDFYRSKNLDFKDCLANKVNTVYRVCPEKRNPLDTTGSAINGGRHHIGGPQQHVLFGNVSVFFALYASCEIQTAIDEYTNLLGLPLGPKDKGFKISLKSGLKIYDLDKIVKKIDNPLLASSISDSPIWGEWRYQKFPHITQLIGFLLYKNFNADGLIFSSTKCKNGKNLALFFDTNIPSIVSEKIDKEETISLL